MQAHDNLFLDGFFSDVTLHDVHITQEYNEHARIHIKGHIPSTIGEKFILKTLENQALHLQQKASNTDTSPETIFRGIALKVQIHHTSDFYTIEIDGISFSYLLDIKISSQSYQNVHMSFDDVIQNQIAGLDVQYINADSQKDEKIAKFTLKYHESIWEFIRRLISRHFIGLVPDIKSEKIAFWINLPENKEIKTLSEGRFQSMRILSHGEMVTKNTWVSASTASDFFGYTFLNRLENFNIGDIIAFEGLNLHIIKINSRLDRDKAILFHDITAMIEAGCKQPLYYNGLIQGLSLEGSVIDRRKDFTKMHLFSIDEKQDTETATWFRQPTYYTAGKDRGWCAMPEINDQLSLHFPTVEENDCYLLDSTQVPYSQINANVSASSNSAKQKSGTKDDQKIPASKFIHAPNGQAMLLEDDLILFHSKENFSSLALHENHKDDKGKALGITMRTKGDISLESENIHIGVIEDISKNVIIESQESIEFVCAMGSMIIDANDGVHFKAPKVRLYPEIEYTE